MKFAAHDGSSARTLSMDGAARTARPALAATARVATAPASRTPGYLHAAQTAGGHHQAPTPPAPTSRVTHQRPSTVAYGRGQVVFGPQSGHGLIYIVRSGCIRLFKTLPDGRSVNVGLLSANTVFAQEDSTDALATGTTAEAMVPSTLSIVEEHDLTRLIAASPDLASAVVTGMTRRMTELQTLIEQLLVRDTSVRLATTLLSLVTQFGSPTGDGLRVITLPLTHQALANMIGSNRVTVTRKLIEFQRLGVVRTLARNSLAVNPDRLRELAQARAEHEDEPGTKRDRDSEYDELVAER